MSVTLYIEGGAKGNLARECRKGFSLFLQKAGLCGKMPRIVACGCRRDAYDDFCTAIKNGKKSILLVDSESAVPLLATDDEAAPWEHVKNGEGDGWEKPEGVSNNELHFMVLCMETWFLADKEAISTYFGQGFNINALPKRADIENISKKDIYDGLSKATKNTQKGKYGKGKHSFEILSLINPGNVESASPYAKRFLTALKGL